MGEKNRHVMQKCVLTIIGLSISWMFNNEDYKYRRTLLQHISNFENLTSIPKRSRLLFFGSYSTCLCGTGALEGGRDAPGGGHGEDEAGARI